MRVVIVGAGPAGTTVAETIRSRCPRTELVMITAEPFPPYSPPAMVDHFLSGSQAHLWRGDDWPQRMGVDYRNGIEVAAVDPQEHLLSLADGEQVFYDRLVIASGSRLYAPIPGADLDGVCNFKSLGAARDLVERVRSGAAASAVIVGAGFIGMEVALLLRELGAEVIQLEMLDQVMATTLDSVTAGTAASQLRARGVDLRLSTKAAGFVGNGRTCGVELDDGTVLRADLYVAATGVRPNVELIEGSGIAYEWGITVDDHLRTSAADVWAVGDVAETTDRLTGESFVHAIFPNAVEQARVAALNVVGDDVIYAGAERMNCLKHLGLPIMAAGMKDGDEVLRVGDESKLRTLYLEDNRLVGFQLIGDLQVAGVLRTLMLEGRDLSAIKDCLLEPGFGQGTVVWGTVMPQ